MILYLQIDSILNLTKHTNIKYFKALLPIFGTILFVVLYITATFYYPGGSQFNHHSPGFSWVHNYWCNLLDDNAINGQQNTAQPIALTAMFILCFTLAFFWWQFPKFTSLGKVYKLTIQVCGTLAMATGLLLYTKTNHDLVTNSASLFGLIATTGTIAGLYKNGWTTLFYYGLLNLLLVAVNNFLYYNKEVISFLPSIQKITFATFLVWICCITIKMYRSIKTNGNNNEK